MKMTAKKVLNKILTVCLIISLMVGMIPATFAKAAPTIAISGTVNNSGNYISLNWSNSDSTGSYRYMVTKKDGSSTTYQTIPLKRTAKVLNIYPGGGTPIVGRTDLAGKLLDTSANVKLWMEEEGVGKSNGNTLITVDCIKITDFNNNPGNYLKKDTNGNYNYDVVFTGAWDNNNDYDLTSSSKSVIQSFITAGGGYLGGHDTTNGYNNIHPYFNALAKDNLNMAIGTETTIPLYGGSNPTTTIDINIVKKGSLINYPWTVSGTTLTVPSSHTTHQFAMGDVWMKYTSSQFNTIEKTSFNGNAGTSNFYLTTWNNVAMIQTGHSNGNATIDEKKILANTLLYLAQISTETTFDDHTAQDVTAPNSINASTVQINVDADKKATVAFTGSEDNGNTYNYQLKAMGMTDNSTTWSEPISQTITSGMKGYAIVVDKIVSTVPSDTVTTTACTYDTTALSTGTWYAHIKAIDNAGNVSSVIHVPFTVSQAPASTYAVLGTIKDTNSNAVTGAAIALINTTDSTKTYSGTTDANGNYNITGVPNGTYSITVTKNGETLGSGSITVNGSNVSGGSANITATAPTPPASTYTVSGTIKDTNTIAVSGAAIVLTNTTDATKTYSGTTDANGNYSITGVPNGTYSITVTMNGETLGSGSITVNGSNVSGGSGNITVTPATPPVSTYTVSGTIKDTNSIAVSGAAIVLTNTADVTKTYSGTTDANGNYSITGVQNGTYSIAVTKNGETLGSGSITVNGSNVSGGSGNITVTPATPTPTPTPSTVSTPAPAPSTSEQVDKVTEAENAIDKMNNSDKASIITALEKLEVLNQDELGQMKRDSLSKLSKAIEKLENVKIVIENSAEDMDIKIMDSEYLGLILTSKELKSGEEIIVKLTIKNFKPELSGTSQIEKTATELGKNIGGYVDITLTKQVGNQEPVIVSETKEDIYVCVVIPENLRGHNYYQIIREHKNETKLLYDTDNDPNTITVPTNLFSTYAIAYSEVLSAEEIIANGLVTKTVLENGKSFTSGLYSYEVTKSGKEPQISVVGFVKGKYAKKVIISKTVEFNGITYKVTAIKKKAFYKDSRITSVSIGDNVATIGGFAFYGCSALKSITIGTGLKTLNNHCFCQCIALNTVRIKSTQLKKANGDHFFYNVKGVTFYLPMAKVEGYKKLLSIHNKRLLKENTFSKIK